MLQPSSHSLAGPTSLLTRYEVDAPFGPYGRLFPALAPWNPGGSTEEESLERLWELAAQLAPEPTGGENSRIPAGYTYFGQLIAHDLSFDAGPSLKNQSRVEGRGNYRTPRFDLDCIYGRGPTDNPFLYSLAPDSRSAGREKLLLGMNEAGEWDLPRNRDESLDDASTAVRLNRQRTPLIGDPRNDESLILSQLHVQLLRFHNRLVEGTAKGGGGKSFAEARRLTRWHYQWVVLNDFLPRLCGRDVVEEVLRARRSGGLAMSHALKRAFIPIEFSAAVYRAGHSMVRERYQLSDALEKARGPSGPVWIFSDPIDLSNSLQGGRELPPGWTIQWDHFVSCGGPRSAQLSMKIDTHLSAPLTELPLGEKEPRYNSLAFRTLVRGWRLGLPSGQDVAAAMGIKPREGCDPLWLYVLKEAEDGGGSHLGAVGARIVAEVFIALLAADPGSFFAAAPRWTPSDDIAHGTTFELRDLLRLAGAPLTSDDWVAEKRAADARADYDGRRRRLIGTLLRGKDADHRE